MAAWIGALTAAAGAADVWEGASVQQLMGHSGVTLLDVTPWIGAVEFASSSDGAIPAMLSISWQ
jgi:hypothetical protein